nr:hypothetical protein [Tanacetum cinerariifolium]
KREFSNARTPQQNGVAERRKRTLIEAARTMLADAKLPVTFWTEAVNTACYVQNRVLVIRSQNRTPYELFNGRTPAIGFLKPFGCHVMILNTLDDLGKFEAKGDEGYFIGYSMSSKAFRVFNKRTRRVEENLHVEFLENNAIEKGAGPNWLFDIDSLTYSMNYVPVDAGINSTNLSGTKDAASQEVKKDVSSLRYIALPNWVHDALLESSSSKPQDDCSTDVPESSRNFNPTATSTNPLADQLETLTVETSIPTVSSPVPTACFTDSPEPLNILGVTTNSTDSDGVEADVSNMETAITASPTPALKIHKDHPKNPSWVEAMQEELLQFKIQNVWTLVDCPKGVRPIGTKWVLKNKKDEIGIVIRNKARLVAQGHIHEEGIDYDEVFAPVARIKAIGLFLAYASFMGFTVYQMDVKSAFLYGTIDEEVYVMQPPGFQDPEFPAKVYKVEKAMYGLHQASRAWQRGDFILVQVYVDDIIFGSSNPQLCREFDVLMHEKFQMSAMGELNFFLGMQVLQKEDGIFLSQDKYVGDILKKFRYSDVRSSNTPMDKEYPWGKDGTGKDVDLHLYRSMIGSLMYLTASRPDIMFAVFKRIFRYLKGHPKLGLWYPKEYPFDLVAYSDSDYGGATQDRKSTTRRCQFLGRMLSMPCEAPSKEILPSVLRFIKTMARLQFCDYHNMVVILEKSEHNVDFHPIVDFVKASPLRIVPLFDTMLVPQGEGSSTPTEPHHTPSPEALQTSSTTPSSPTLPSVTIAPIPTVTLSDIPTLRQYTRRARIAQSSALPPVADEPASPLRDVSEGEACPTDSSFKADQDRANIAKSSTLPHDLAPRVTSPAADEGSMQLKLDELKALCTSLQRQHSEMVAKFEAHELEIHRLKARVKLLEDREGLFGERSGDDAPIKGRNLDEGEATAEKASDDTEEMAIVLTSMDAATVLASGVAEVPTGNGSIPTAGPPAADVPTGSDMVPTVGPIFATATVIDAQVARELEEQMAREDQRMSEQVARDAEIARIHAEEELQIMIDGLDMSNETVAKYQDNYAKVHKYQSQQRKPWSKKQNKDYYMVVIRSNLGWKVKDFRGMTFKEIKAKFTTVWKQIENFIPMGSKEEAERFKKKGIRFEQESVKKLKTSEEVSEKVKSPDEVPKEKVKEMMQLVPIEEVYIEALQVKHPIIDWKVRTEGQRSYWKGGFKPVIGLVKESLSIRPPTSDKEMELWMELKRLYEPDDEDQLVDSHSELDACSS